MKPRTIILDSAKLVGRSRCVNRGNALFVVLVRVEVQQRELLRTVRKELNRQGQHT